MYFKELYERERHADFVREAERDQLARRAQKRAGKPFYKPALVSLGAKLVEVGNRLQDNVDTVSTAPMMRVSKRA